VEARVEDLHRGVRALDLRIHRDAGGELAGRRQIDDIPASALVLRDGELALRRRLEAVVEVELGRLVPRRGLALGVAVLWTGSGADTATAAGRKNRRDGESRNRLHVHGKHTPV